MRPLGYCCGAGTSSAAETYKLLNLVLWSDTLHDSAKHTVILPPGYDANFSRRYPVVYMASHCHERPHDTVAICG